MFCALKCKKYEQKALGEMCFLFPRAQNRKWPPVGYKSDDKVRGECQICAPWPFGPWHSRAPPHQDLGFPFRCWTWQLPPPPPPPAPPTKRPATTVHVLVSLKCFFSKLHILSKLFAHITAICVQGSLKQVRVWKAMESTRGSEIHKPGKAMIQREAALLCSSKLKSTQGDRAAAACLGWFLLTWLDLVPHVWIEPPARSGNQSTPTPNMTKFDLYISPPPCTSTVREPGCRERAES